MYVVGVDLGQAQDPTALCILQREAKRTDKRDGLNREFWEDHYFVQHLERPELKTAYPEIVRLIERTVRHPKLAGQCELVVDATGVGRPVVDMMREHDLSPIPVTITGGQALTMGTDAFWHVPKRMLVSSMAIVLQSGRLHIPKRLSLSATLAREMLNFKVKISAAAHDSYGEWRDGEHDDLVLAVALAVWWAERAPLGGWRGGRDELAERRRLRHIEKQETPWWRQRTASDRGPNARWRR
mgnify:CR=1 FL=1